MLETEDIKSLGLGAIWNFSKVTGHHDSIWNTKGPLNQGLGASGLRGPEPKCISISDQSITHIFIQGSREEGTLSETITYDFVPQIRPELCHSSPLSIIIH